MKTIISRLKCLRPQYLGLGLLVFVGGLFLSRFLLTLMYGREADPAVLVFGDGIQTVVSIAVSLFLVDSFLRSMKTPEEVGFAGYLFESFGKAVGGLFLGLCAVGFCTGMLASAPAQALLGGLMYKVGVVYVLVIAALSDVPSRLRRVRVGISTPDAVCAVGAGVA